MVSSNGKEDQKFILRSFMVLEPSFRAKSNKIRFAFQEKIAVTTLSKAQQVQILPFRGYNTFDKVLPVLNRDNKHYTPLFILEEDKVHIRLDRNFTRSMMKEPWPPMRN